MMSKIPEFSEEILRLNLHNLKDAIDNSKKVRYENPKSPELWIESDILIEKYVRKISILSAYPEMIRTFVTVEGVQLLSEVIKHANTTLTLSALTFLLELTEIEIVENEKSLSHLVFLVDEILSNRIIEDIIQNMNRYDETREDEKEGIFKVLGVLENVLEIKPEATQQIGKGTYLFNWIVKK